MIKFISYILIAPFIFFCILFFILTVIVSAMMAFDGIKNGDIELIFIGAGIFSLFLFVLGIWIMPK